MNPNFNSVSERFFESLGMPLRTRGASSRPPTARGRPEVAVVNDIFARHFFGEPERARPALRSRPQARNP